MRTIQFKLRQLNAYLKQSLSADKSHTREFILNNLNDKMVLINLYYSS